MPALPRLDERTRPWWILAGAVGLAVTGAVFQSLRSDRLAAGEGRGEAFSSALAEATWILVGLVAAGAALTWLLLRAPAAEPAPEPPERSAEPEPPEHRMHHRRFHL